MGASLVVWPRPRLSHCKSGASWNCADSNRRIDRRRNEVLPSTKYESARGLCSHVYRACQRARFYDS